MLPIFKIFALVARPVKWLLSKPAIRGTLKTLPVGNFLYELAEYRSRKKAGKDPLHHPQSLFIQFLWLSLIIYVLYGLFSGKLTIDQLATFLSSFGFDDLPLPQAQDITDSIQ